MQSIEYTEAVEKGKLFHKKNKSWNGSDSKKYIHEVSALVKTYNAKTMLDYGCGKGLQYNLPYNFASRANIESYYLYDPCVENLDVLPPEGQTFDAIICLQVIKHIPDNDFVWLKEFFEKTATKFVLIGDFDPAIHKKPKKILNTDSFNRDIHFYKELFNSWNSPAELFFYWRRPMSDEARLDNQKLMDCVNASN